MNYKEILEQKREQNPDIKYQKFGLKLNPFPKSGTANINESSEKTELLIPIDDVVLRKIYNYVGDSLYSSDDEDHKLIGTITGDYGTGKTQLLLFAKALILNEPKKAYVLYINNPGTKLSKLIGSIIENIGQEDFKKFIWNNIIDVLKVTPAYKSRLEKFRNNMLLFRDADPFTIENSANHKLFLDSFKKQITSKNTEKEFNEVLKSIIIEILEKKYDDIVIATYFYELVSEDFGVSKTWEALVSGDGNFLGNKVVTLLNAIVTIIEEQGFQRFYLLVDEFEDITSGRLSKKEQDQYTHNLRTLLDKQRKWCLLIAMTGTALKDVEKLSPPLYDRMTDRLIPIERLSNEKAHILIKNYLNLAKEGNKDNLLPFEEDAIDYLNQISDELPRLVLRHAFFVLERAVEELGEGAIISKDFVEKQIVN